MLPDDAQCDPPLQLDEREVDVDRDGIGRRVVR